MTTLNIPVCLTDMRVTHSKASPVSGYKITFSISTDTRVSNSLIRHLVKTTRLPIIARKMIKEYVMQNSDEIMANNEILNAAADNMYTANHGVLCFESDKRDIVGYIKICQKGYTLKDVIACIDKAKFRVGTTKS